MMLFLTSGAKTNT